VRGRAQNGSSSDPVSQLRELLTQRIGEARFEMWFSVVAFVPTGRELLVVVQTAQHQQMLEQMFTADLQAVTDQVFGSTIQSKIIVDPQASAQPVDTTPPRTTPPVQKNLFNEESPQEPKKRKPAKTNRRFRSLAEFVVGSTNRVAHASALAVVEDPGQHVNPLVLHGPVGTGKTHLLEGIYAGLRKLWPDDRPVFVSAEDFTTRFVQSTRYGKQDSFRRQFRDCSALLLDDLDFLSTKPQTQEEFLHTFDVLHSDGKQIVVTMDCHPRLIDELMPELVDRLLGGGVWGLLPPDEPTRLEILRKKSTGVQPVIPDEMLKYLAHHLPSNVRELEGALNSIRHYARVTSKPIDLTLVKDALGDLLRHTHRAITLPDVDAAVCRILRLSAGMLQSKARTWAVSHPRMLAIYLARKLTIATYGEISRHFGAKTHSSAVAAEKRVRIWIETNERLSLGDREWRAKDLIERLERELQR
jgi:chromosomal replication initiator protein